MRHMHSDTDPALVPSAELLLLPLLHTPASASAVLVLILMSPLPPLLRVHHYQPSGYCADFFPSEAKTSLLGVRHVAS